MVREEDYIQQLADYIKKNLVKGYTLDSLRIALESQDYSRSAIERAAQLANEQLAKQAPPMKEKPRIKYKIVSDKKIEQIEKSEKEKSKKGFLGKLFE